MYGQSKTCQVLWQSHTPHQDGIHVNWLHQSAWHWTNLTDSVMKYEIIYCVAEPLKDYVGYIDKLS